MAIESVEELHARWRESLGQRPEVRRLWNSEEFKGVVAALKNRKRRKHATSMDAELWVTQRTMSALRDLEPAERMTRTQRRATARKIERCVEELRESLESFFGEDHHIAWPFQPAFDLAALDISVAYAERFADETGDIPELEHRARGPVYFAMGDQFSRMLDAVSEGAEHLAVMETVLKKPNDENARRLYFLRMMTRHFCAEFGSPLRVHTLSLASIFFDCSDLDEAAVATLAPVLKPKPVIISQEEVDRLRQLVVSSGLDAERINEILGEFGASAADKVPD